MSESILLTDSDEPALEQAVAQLDGWQRRARRAAELAERDRRRPACAPCSSTRRIRRCCARSSSARTRAAFRSSSPAPTTRRVAAPSSSGPRNGIRCPADAEEIAQRIRAAVGRGTPPAPGAADRVERVEYEQMLHDSLTGLPTLPVMIERSRALFKERGELVVLYLNFVRYSKIEEIYGWEKLDAVLETTAARGARVSRRHGAEHVAR